MEQGVGGDFLWIARELERLANEGEAGTLALVIRTRGSVPGRVGAKMVVLLDGRIRGTVGGGSVEARVICDAQGAAGDGRGPRTMRYDLEELGMTCGGEMEVYLEPIAAPKHVILYGGGHVAAAIACVLETLHCRITVVDERKEWANRERFPGAEELINRPFAEHLALHPPGSQDHVLIVTRGHEEDQLVLEAVIGHRPAYLGMIGSRKKARDAAAELRAKGIPDDLVQTVRSPVGLDIGAVTPEEIAIAVAAELILVWRRGLGPACVQESWQRPSGAQAGEEASPEPERPAREGEATHDVRPPGGRRP